MTSKWMIVRASRPSSLTRFLAPKHRVDHRVDIELTITASTGNPYTRFIIWLALLRTLYWTEPYQMNTQIKFWSHQPKLQSSFQYRGLSSVKCLIHNVRRIYNKISITPKSIPFHWNWVSWYFLLITAIDVRHITCWDLPATITLFYIVQKLRNFL